MKILFICGCLEPGKDGVGDYCRQLAAEIIRKGYAATIVSYNDAYTQTIEQTDQYVDDVGVSVVRIPSKFKSIKKIAGAKAWTQKFNPDWISVQFVPYAFHDKGLPFLLSKQLRAIGTDRKWHIMFHELWIGVSTDNLSIKQNLIKYFQKQLIYRLIDRLSPKIINTSIATYERELDFVGCEMLPLFGNIPIVNDAIASLDGDDLRVVIFGTFSSDLDGFRSQLIWLKSNAIRLKRSLQITIMGNGGKFKLESLAILCQFTDSSKIIDMGLVSEETVSKVFLSAHVGISRADAQNWGKSGSTVAMLEHGLNVILRGSKFNSVVHPILDVYAKQLFFVVDDSTTLQYRKSTASLLKPVCDIFLDKLTTHNT